MKITKRGVPNWNVWEGRCSKCNSEAQATEDELTSIYRCQRNGSHSWEKCPVCGAGPNYGMLFKPKGDWQEGS